MSFFSTLLGNLTKIRTGKLDANAANSGGKYPFFTCAQEPLAIDRYAYDCDAILVAGNGDLNVKHYKGKIEAYQRTYLIEVADESKLDSRYLYYFMSKYVEKLRELSIGGVIKYIKLGMLTDAKIPLPPLAEQKRIAAILDKADAIRLKRAQGIKLADDFIRSLFFDMFGDPVLNPKGWRRSRIEDVLENIDSGWSPKCLDRAANSVEWGVLKLGAVTSCQYIEHENKALPSTLKPQVKLEVKKGDLLFTRKNTYELVAACAYVYETRPKLMISDTIFRFKLRKNAEISPEYLWALLTHYGKRRQLQSLASGSAGSMPNISKARLSQLEIESPPFGMQDKFAKIFHKIKAASNKQVALIEKSGELFNSLTQSAFIGELKQKTDFRL